MTSNLHIQNPLLFAFLQIIDAAPFNAHLFAPVITSSLSRLPSLIPQGESNRFPAFSYVTVETRKPDPKRVPPPQNVRILHTIEAALWEKMPDIQSIKDCDWYYTALDKYTDPTDANINTGLLIKEKAVIDNLLIELQAKLTMLIYALDAKPDNITESTFENAFGFKRDGDIVWRYYTDTSSNSLLGVVARFQLWIDDNQNDICNRCGWSIDMSKLTNQALTDKLDIVSLKNCFTVS